MEKTLDGQIPENCLIEANVFVEKVVYLYMLRVDSGPDL